MSANETPCPCGASAGQREVFRTPTRRYVACPVCQLVFQSPQPGAERVQAFYRDEYDEAYGQAQSGVYRQPVYQSVYRHLSSFAIPPGRLLDIGCGDGEFLVLCRAHGWSGVGIELSQDASRRALARGLTLLPVSWLHQPGPRESDGQVYDAIAMINVLDAVVDPVEILSRVRTWLSPGGWLILRVPNGAFHLSLRRAVRLVGAQYRQAFNLFVFTPASLRLLLQRAGFQVMSVRNSSPSRGQVSDAGNPVARWLWQVAGGLLWGAAEALYYTSGRRLICAPSFEVVARNSGGVA